MDLTVGCYSSRRHALLDLSHLPFFSSSPLQPPPSPGTDLVASVVPSRHIVTAPIGAQSSCFLPMAGGGNASASPVLLHALVAAGGGKGRRALIPIDGRRKRWGKSTDSCHGLEKTVGERPLILAGDRRKRQEVRICGTLLKIWVV
jgi:hypothetical protein